MVRSVRHIDVIGAGATVIHKKNTFRFVEMSGSSGGIVGETLCSGACKGCHRVSPGKADLPDHIVPLIRHIQAIVIRVKGEVCRKPKGRRRTSGVIGQCGSSTACDGRRHTSRSDLANPVIPSVCHINVSGGRIKCQSNGFVESGRSTGSVRGP